MENPFYPIDLHDLVTRFDRLSLDRVVLVAGDFGPASARVDGGLFLSSRTDSGEES